MKGKLNRRLGFTIIEIIVAVVIMAALFTVLVNSLSGVRARAERSPKQAQIMKDAVIYKQEVAQLIENGIKDPARIKDIMENRHDKDPFGEEYKFEIDGSALTVKPGTSATEAGLHDEVIILDAPAAAHS